MITDNPFIGKLKNKILPPALIGKFLTMPVARQHDCKLPELIVMLLKEANKRAYMSNENWIEKLSPALISQS